MQIDAIQTQQESAVNGIPPVSPVAGASSATSPESQSSVLFGPAYVRDGQTHTGESFPLYSADGSLRKETASSGEADLADARAVQKLESRDRQTRQREEGKGEAVGSRNYIYQTGPDGKRYAIGTAAHTVREEEPSGTEGTKRGADGDTLSREDQALLDKLEARDTKVRNHEAQHVMAAGGQAQGAPTYTYQTGPDGRRYAVGGSVNIATMTTGDPEQDARQARNAERAAMATGEPSSRDMQAAQTARLKEADASQRQRDAALDAYERQGAVSYA